MLYLPMTTGFNIIKSTENKVNNQTLLNLIIKYKFKYFS